MNTHERMHGRNSVRNVSHVARAADVAREEERAEAAAELTAHLACGALS
jgi:hypothetical protein